MNAKALRIINKHVITHADVADYLPFSENYTPVTYYEVFK